MEYSRTRIQTGGTHASLYFLSFRSHYLYKVKGRDSTEIDMEDSRQVTFKWYNLLSADRQRNKLTYGASNNLGENVQLVLCFMPRVPGLFEKRFSIVWK